MQPIRVLNLFTIMDRGGAETMVMNLYRHIDRTKVQFDFMVYHQERGCYDDEIETLGGTIYRLPKLRPKNILQYKRALKIFFKEHKEYKIIHGHMGTTGYYVYKEAKRQGVPVIIVHSHATKSKIAGLQLYSRFKKMVRAIFKNLMWEYVTDGFACGYAAREAMFGKDNTSANILYNAIDAEKFAYNPKIAYEMKVKLGIEGKFVVGHVGRIDLNKNQSFAIDIFKSIYDRQPNSVLLFVGDGELRNVLEAKIKHLNLENNVILTGVRPDIPELMQTIDVFLFPSLYEGLPVAAIEAQAAGLPCVLSDTVAKETNITNLCEFISLNEPANIWAEKILKYERKFERKSMQDEIYGAGYDIAATARWLQNYYLNKYREVGDSE